MDAVIPDKLIARLSFGVSVVDVQFAKLVDEFSVALASAGFTPLPPIMLVTGNPAPFVDLKISTVTEPLGVPSSNHPCNVPPYGILIGFFVPVETTAPEPSTDKVTERGTIMLVTAVGIFNRKSPDRRNWRYRMR